MQVAFIRTHNRIVDRLRADGVDEGDVFEEARRTATWHYQWVILTEFLPLLVGQSWWASCSTAAGRCSGPEEDPYIPFEFADAAYRYGHSQIRDTYRVNRDFGPVPVFPDLMGFGAVPVGRTSTGRSSSTCPGTNPRSAPRRSTARLPAA